MDLKQLITRLAYRIEPKPEGGFIARATDPTVRPLEAPTREQLQQKIRENTASALSAEFPGLKFPAYFERAFHIEHKPGGGFSIHSADPNAPVMEVADLNEFETQFLNNAGFGGNLIPSLVKTFAAQLGSAQVGNGTMDIVVKRQTTFGTKNSSSTLFSTASPPVAAPTLGGAVGNSPITPESSSSWKIFCFILLAIVAALVYAFVLHR